MARKWLDIANQWVDNQDEEEKKEGDHPRHENGWRFGGERSSWGEKRAVMLKKPEEPIVGEPGQVVFAEVEVQNQTKWPWKRGCYVGVYLKD